MLLMVVTIAVINLTERLARPWRLASLGAALLGCAILIRPIAFRIQSGFGSLLPSDLIGPARAHWLMQPRVIALILESFAFGCLAAAPIYLRRQRQGRSAPCAMRRCNASAPRASRPRPVRLKGSSWPGPGVPQRRLRGGRTHRCRLRAAGVSDEDRCALLGHATHTMSGHYESGDLGRLMREANLVLNRQETRTVLRIVAGRFMSPKTATSENHATGTCA